MSESSRRARWSGADYARTEGHHRSLDAWFLDRMPPGPGDVVVDLGSGSGEFSARLADLVPEGRVIGVEPDPSMLATARSHERANLEFVGARAEELDAVVEHGSVDLVVSRAMLHWLPLSHYGRCFAAVLNVLRPGAWFHSESGGAGNVAAVVALMTDVGATLGLPSPPPFPDAGVALELLEGAGFVVPPEGARTVAQRRSFSRDGLVAFLRAQAVVIVTRDAPADLAARFVEAVVANADRLRRRDGSWDQTFVRLELLAQRPASERPVP